MPAFLFLRGFLLHGFDGDRERRGGGRFSSDLLRHLRNGRLDHRAYHRLGDWAPGRLNCFPGFLDLLADRLRERPYRHATKRPAVDIRRWNHHVRPPRHREPRSLTAEASVRPYHKRGIRGA
jgi:hypothetical protein